MVGEVEELDSELHVVLLTYHPAFGQPEIEVDDAVPLQDVIAGIAELVLGRLGEGRGVEPAVQRPVLGGQISVAGAV